MIASFFRFWWSFIVGDDWRIAAAVAVGVTAVAVLAHAGVHAWWLLPLVVTGALGGSILRASRRQ